MVLLCLNKSPTINYSLKSIVLHLQLCSTRYTALCKKLLCLNPAVQTKRTRAPMINYTLKSKVNITLYLLLYSACYTALLTNNCVKNLNPCCFRKKQWEAILYYYKSTPVKRTGTKEDKGSTMILAMWLLQLAKGTPQDKAMLSSEEINPIALSVVAWPKVSVS